MSVRLSVCQAIHIIKQIEVQHLNNFQELNVPEIPLSVRLSVRLFDHPIIGLFACLFPPFSGCLPECLSADLSLGSSARPCPFMFVISVYVSSAHNFRKFSNFVSV